MTAQPQSISQLTHAQVAPITHLLFDFDDTVTWAGQLPQEAANALYRAYDAGFQLMAVTGRPAAWAEMLMRLFPFEAAVAETGAICFYRETLPGKVSVLHSIDDPKQRETQTQQRLAIAHAIMADLPEARLALDNMGRIYDSAFDLVEDGPAVSEATQKLIHQKLDAEGLFWAQSSVHINFFWQAFNKTAMVKRYFEEIGGQPWPQWVSRFIYFGDSTNDGPLFRAVPLGIGVANIANYLPLLQKDGSAPSHITAKPGGHGFAEAIDHLVHLKNM
ncbi:MAG: hypothetical protein CMH56_12465 [Myxococcales bacterium]|nr:hypothetical protein [Myxococcales bacterium]|tara:strand:+ start:823 stop:1647 length:825 start_codon:yes stop_codon:yes gene_type:complete